MRKLAVIELLSLDGVMQAPAGPDEDTEGGFRHGGWSREYFDETSAAAAAAGMARTDAYLSEERPTRTWRPTGRLRRPRIRSPRA
jgi:hypothetical protein